VYKNWQEYTKWNYATVRSFIFVGHLISCISWVEQSTNLWAHEIFLQFENFVLLKSTTSSVYKHVHYRNITKCCAHEIKWFHSIMHRRREYILQSPLLRWSSRLSPWPRARSFSRSSRTRSLCFFFSSLCLCLCFFFTGTGGGLICKPSSSSSWSSSVSL